MRVISARGAVADGETVDRGSPKDDHNLAQKIGGKILRAKNGMTNGKPCKAGASIVEYAKNPEMQIKRSLGRIKP